MGDENALQLPNWTVPSSSCKLHNLVRAIYHFSSFPRHLKELFGLSFFCHCRQLSPLQLSNPSKIFLRGTKIF